MKSILTLFLIFFINSVHSQEYLNSKKYRHSEFTLNYPRTWKFEEFNGYVLFRPKEISALDKLGPNQVFVYPGEVSINKKNIEEALNAHASNIDRHEVEKKFKIIKLNNESKFIYKIEYEVLFEYNNDIYKQIEYLYKEGSKLKFYYYLMRKDLFDKYYDEAMFIINSIKKR
jgi:hypothetical protein